MSDEERVVEATEHMIIALKDAGFIIQMYESITTNSVYLKLDYGVMRTIRMSDHRGKKRFRYRYNIGTNVDRAYHDDITNRYYFPIEEVDRLIEMILRDRMQLKQRYGEYYYADYMDRNLRANEYKQGFWGNSTTI